MSGISIRKYFTRPLAVAVLLFTTVLTQSQCGSPGKQPSPEEDYHLTPAEREAWRWNDVAQADSVAKQFWGLLGKGSFDSAMAMVDSYQDPYMTQIFRDRIEKLWLPVVNWPAASLTEEPAIGLGKSKTIGFRTWAQLWSGGFQRAVLCDDSITAFFVFKGFWQTDSIPLYAAVACGNFATAAPQWRPFPYVVFSLDAAEETIKTLGAPQRNRSLDEFVDYLRTRTFSNFVR